MPLLAAIALAIIAANALQNALKVKDLEKRISTLEGKK